MKPVVLVRSALVACLLAFTTVCFTATQSLAGDTANRHILGFSKDARWFAFAEFGVQDGSGFPYANLYMLDVTRDRWAPGTPVRVLIKDEKTNVSDAYDALLKKSAGKLRKYGTRYPGRLLASRPLAEDWDRTLDVGKSNALRFKVRYPYGHDATVRVNMFDAGDKSDCFDLWSPQGLSLTVASGDGGPKEIYRDKRIPKSRTCAQGYVLADVYDATEGHTGDKHRKAVALIYVFTHGFEGKDARFIAIPFDIPGSN